jgi:hypothetical protein
MLFFSPSADFTGMFLFIFFQNGKITLESSQSLDQGMIDLAEDNE